MKSKKSIIVSITLFLVFSLLTLLLIYEDVNFVGETNKEVGLSGINEKYSYLEYNKVVDIISDIPLFLSIELIGVLAVTGFIQLIKRKSLFKVDKDITIFGVFIIVLAIFWIAFDKFFIINYRPILIDGEVEPSYPSTHILIVTFTMLSSISILYKYLKNRKIIIVMNLISSLLISITFVLRLASGMHWFTDCLGGMILGLSMYCLYVALKKEKLIEEEK